MGKYKVPKGTIPSKVSFRWWTNAPFYQRAIKVPNRIKSRELFEEWIRETIASKSKAYKVFGDWEDYTYVDEDYEY